MATPTQSDSDWKTPQGLREVAGGYLHDNQAPGEPGYCEPDQANWTLENLSPEALTNVFASVPEAKAWFDAELAMDREDELHRDWHRLLVEEIQEDVVVLVRDGAAHVWDGWHRIAASIITGRAVKAIVGRPIAQPA